VAVISLVGLASRSQFSFVPRGRRYDVSHTPYHRPSAFLPKYRPGWQNFKKEFISRACKRLLGDPISFGLL